EFIKCDDIRKEGEAVVSIKKEKLWCLDFGKEGDVIRYLANDNEFHGEKSKWVLEEELFVTDESVPLVDERIQRNNHPFAKPIFQKDGELSYDYLVIEPQKWDGFLPVAKVLGRDEFKSYMGVKERKSTRLNSSLVSSSYAVFCL